MHLHFDPQPFINEELVTHFREYKFLFLLNPIFEGSISNNSETNCERKRASINIDEWAATNRNNNNNNTNNQRL